MEEEAEIMNNFRSYKDKLKSLLVNLTIVCISIGVAITICEFYFRIIYKTIALSPRYHTDAKYGDFTLRRIRPNSDFWHTNRHGSIRFVTNNKGFRNYEDIPYEKADKEIRVISLGDSHTQGYEVRQEYTFSAILEQYLRKQSYNATVINAGVSGFSIAEELVFLENEGIKYKPDFVVLGFSVNDFGDNVKSDLFRLNNNRDLVLYKKEHIPGVHVQNILYNIPLFHWISNNSYFYSYVFNNVWHYYKRQLFKKSKMNTFEYMNATEDDLSEYYMDLMSALIKRMYEFCEKNKIKLIIIDIPASRNLGVLKSAVPLSLEPFMREHSDTFIDSKDILSSFFGVVPLHVGYHISEFSHIMFGLELGKRIVAELKNAD